MLKSGQKLGLEILEALGIPSEHVVSVSVECKVNEVAIAKVSYAVFDENNKLSIALRKYEIKEAA